MYSHYGERDSRSLLKPNNYSEKCAAQGFVAGIVLLFPLSLASAFWIVTQAMHHMGWLVS